MNKNRTPLTPDLFLNRSPAAVPRNPNKKPPIRRQIDKQLVPAARTCAQTARDAHLDVFRLERLPLPLRTIRPRPARRDLAGRGNDALPGHGRVGRWREELEGCRSYGYVDACAMRHGTIQCGTLRQRGEFVRGEEGGGEAPGP
jgi:hypothetical protein